MLGSLRSTMSGAWRALDAPWLQKLGGLATLLWLVPILLGVLRALSRIDVLTVAVLLLGCVGLLVQAVRHRPRSDETPKQASTPVDPDPLEVMRAAPELPWRDDRRDLANDFDVLAQSIEDYLRARAAERPKIEAENVAHAIKENAWPGESEDQIKQRAADYSDTTSKAQYVFTWRDQALALFDKAVAEKVVSPRARTRFAAPKDHAALEKLPDDLRELGRRLRQGPDHESAQW